MREIAKKTTKKREKINILGRNPEYEKGRILPIIGDIIHCTNNKYSVLSNHRQGTNLKNKNKTIRKFIYKDVKYSIQNLSSP